MHRAATSQNEPQLTLSSDDEAASTAWQAALAAEGLHLHLMPHLQPVSEPAADAHVLLLHHGLARGLAHLRAQREAAPTLPLMLACRPLRDLDQVLALEMGADDVIDTAQAAPVAAARLRALLRRRVRAEPGTPRPRELRFGALRLLAMERRAEWGDRRLELSEGEFEVLWLLASQAGQAVARSDILRQVRGLHDHPFDRSIDSRVYRLRSKLEAASGAGARIRTVRNFGYAFSPTGA
jgi:DNA-binding response OmpR family regulator